MKNKYCTRSDRLADLVHKELSEIIIKFCHDPRLEHLTITSVKLTADLAIAKVYFTNFLIDPVKLSQKDPINLKGSSDVQKQVLKILQNASIFLRCRLAEKMNLRKVPELRFFYDENLVYGLKMDLLLTKIIEE